MTTTMASALGRGVVALDTAEDIGEVKSFVVSPDAKRIERLHIAGRRKRALFAEWSDLESFGTDAVVVTGTDAPSGSDDDRDIDSAKGAIDILGARVLTTSGFEVGAVEDVHFDETAGEIVSVLTTRGDTVNASSIVSLGSYALVVTD